MTKNFCGLQIALDFHWFNFGLTFYNIYIFLFNTKVGLLYINILYIFYFYRNKKVQQTTTTTRTVQVQKHLRNL